MNDRRILHGDCRVRLSELEPNSIDAAVTDPPYELGFMGKAWDSAGVAFQVDTWAEVLRVLKPGAHLLGFGGTRTHHRLTCAIEDAGFEIRDCLMWLYGSGFPKSLDVSKAIDKAAGAEREVIGRRIVRGVESGHTNVSGGSLMGRTITDKVSSITVPYTSAANQWQGWGTALKPAYEPIVLARKPLQGTVAANVQQFGTGAINVDGCRVGFTDADADRIVSPAAYSSGIQPFTQDGIRQDNGRPGLNKSCSAVPLGRWPANIIHDGSEDVVALFPQQAGSGFGVRGSGTTDWRTSYAMPGQGQTVGFGDSGSAARFFYCAKASRAERGDGNTHPTVKPQALLRYLIRLITPPHGLVLDPFAGSGSTALAALEEGCRFLGIEQDQGHTTTAEDRVGEAAFLPFGAANGGA